MCVGCLYGFRGEIAGGALLREKCCFYPILSLLLWLLFFYCRFGFLCVSAVCLAPEVKLLVVASARTIRQQPTINNITSVIRQTTSLTLL